MTGPEISNSQEGGNELASVAPPERFTGTTRELFPVVYQQLRDLAHRKMAREPADLTLQTTALVHEVYLRLSQDPAIRWENPRQFFAVAAESMRRILVDNARRRARLKRGGEMRRIDLDNVELTVNEPPDELIALDEALSMLAAAHPEKAQLVKLRYFGGLTQDEAAQALGVSKSTADRHWAYARAWLYRQLSTADGDASL